MSVRPSDWSPLDHDSDPAPGDPGEIEQESLHYRNVANRISNQVDRLRRLANPDEALKGDYTESLQEACEELAGHLERAHGRFETVGNELSRLHPELETAQTKTKTALESAAAAQGEVDAVNGEDHSSLDMLDPDNAEAQAAGKKLAGANDALDDAKQDCRNAVAAYGTVAHDVARKIKDASDDDMKDGRFEGIKSWVKDHADLLRNISTWLGRIVLVLAVLIILLSNPAGWVILAAVIAAGLLLAVDAALAWAGEGSWADVAFDVLGVATLGTGALVGKLAKFGRSMTLFKAGNIRGVQAAGSSLRAAFNGSGFFGKIAAFSNRFRPSTYGDALRAFRDTSRNVRAFPLLDAPLSSAFRWPFSREAASLSDDLARISSEFGPDVVSGLHRGGVSMVKGVAGIEAVTSGIDNALDLGGDFDIPVLGDIDAGLDKLTTREVSPLW